MNKSIRVRLSARFVSPKATLVALALIATIASGQANRHDLRIDDPRPVARGIQLLTAEFPIVITYEDVRYEYESDLRDVAALARNPQRVNSPGQTLVPMGGIPFSLSFELTSGVETRVNEIESVLSQLLSAHAVNGGGGRFRVERAGDVIHVMPSQVRNGDGDWVDQSSILDTLISIPEQNLNGFEMLNLICDELTKAAGIQVGVTTVPIGVLASYEGSIKANNEPARDVLLRTLHSVNKQFTWRLLYAPDMKIYGLNVRAVAAAPPLDETIEETFQNPRAAPPHLTEDEARRRGFEVDLTVSP
jgi:hypothetical protein